MDFGLIGFDFHCILGFPFFLMGFGGGFCFKGFWWWRLGGDGWMVLGGWWNLRFGGGALAGFVRQ